MGRLWIGEALRPAALFIAIALLTSCGGDGRYPSAPIVLVCPWAPGGGTDRVARQAAMGLERELGVPVNVLNATGGAGVVGHHQGATATPDGYTLTMVTVEINTLHWTGLVDLTHEHFEPLMLLGKDPAALFVRSDSRWKTPKELADDALSRPGELKASGTARLGIWHLALGGWLKTAGLSPSVIEWIPNAGSTPSLQSLLAGGVDVVCCSLAEAQNLLSAGRLRCLGAMAPDRLAEFPEVPTLRELGYDWELSAWRGLAMPRGAPPEVVSRLVEAIDRVSKSEAFLAYLRESGFNTVCEGPAEFRRTLETMDARLGAIIRGEGFASLRKDRFGPYFFPQVLAGALLVTLVVIALTGVPIAAVPLTTGGLERRGLLRSAEVAAAVALYILVSGSLGYVLTIGGVLLWLLVRFGTRLRVAALIVVILVPATYQLFAVALHVPLPRGLVWW